ncbi:sorting nexin-14 isoform X2 [Leptinotarsa decemlineata]|uniref:sorting nexin-14 isoform X2 n=1 Tax=Leptinotarsa decemlineata TaxID=7539 RepID=UPI003D3072AC
MISKEISDIIKLVLKDKLVGRVAIIITLFSVLVGIFVSAAAALVLYSSYILGYVVSWVLIKYQSKTAVYLQRLTSFYQKRTSTKVSIKQSCSVCDDLSCKRHQQTKSVTPWKCIHISSDLNEAIEHFYETIISNFISSWYGQFTEDDDFLNELRHCFRFSTATIINRFFELDVGRVIADKLIPCAVRHVDDYLYMQQIGKLKNVRFNEVVLEYLGKRLHAAATNRNNELGYLQQMVSSLLPNVLPDSYLKCRNYSIIMREILAGWVFLPLMDVLADPNIINSLVILVITYKPKKSLKSVKNVETVEFLHNYALSNDKKTSFATNLNKIKNNTDLLYAFMQFLKKQDHVNLLQFCLDVDDFNNKLLNPELSKKQLENLHADALKLYKEYLDKDSYSFIGCLSEISENFGFLMQEVYSIEKLSKLSKLLYAAYDYTFNILENVWLPQFFHSTEFYGYICGSKMIPTFTKQLSKSKKYDSMSQGNVSKLTSGLGKIKGVLKTSQPIEGSFFPIENQSVENGTTDEMFLGDCKSLFRDLSRWKVSIPTYQGSPTNKVIYFYVSVERSDVLSVESKKNWVVLRKDQDFYTLKSKLVEFHGESEICDSPLPSRKAGSSIETRMTKYEEFLRRLLQKSALKGSDLLYYFLTTEEDFTIYIAQNTNIQDIGNIYQSVAYKLRKEKGQHLDSFMASFLNAAGKTKNDKLEWAEIGEELDNIPCLSHTSRLPKTYRNQVFNDNFGVQYKCLKETASSSFNPEGLAESVFYFLKHVFKVHNGFLKIYASICSVAQHIVDTTSRIMIERTLKSNLSQSNLAYLIRLLEDVVFNPHVTPTKEELKQRQARAFEELNNSVPHLVTQIFGSGVKEGLKTLLEIMQNAHFNKQLAYNLLDIVLLEMFPTMDGKLEK